MHPFPGDAGDDTRGSEKRRIKATKNGHYRQMLQAPKRNNIPFRCVRNDTRFASAENMRFVKLDLEKDFIMALKGNHKAALSEGDQSNGKYQRIDPLDLPESSTNLGFPTWRAGMRMGPLGNLSTGK